MQMRATEKIEGQYKQERSHSTHLQQPYIESEEDILGHFLFDKEDIEEKKKKIIRHMEKKTSIVLLKFSCAW